MLGRAVPVALFARDALGARPVGRPASPATASAARKMAIPFAPFLALGGVVALFAGHALLALRT